MAKRTMRKKTKSTRKKTMRRRRCWKGGNPMQMSLAQGKDYLDIHKNQHGGMAPVGTTGVLDDSLRATARIAVLDQSMQQIQGMSDQSGGGKRKGLVQHLGKKLKNMAGTVKRSLVGRHSYPKKLMDAFRKRKSMLGGKRRKTSRKRKAICGGKRKAMSRKRKAMMGGRSSCMRRRMRGGAAMTPLATAQDYSAPGQLLSPQGEARAMMGMNPEWKLATDPNSFAPK
jgi:hypothetical protein